LLHILHNNYGLYSTIPSEFIFNLFYNPKTIQIFYINIGTFIASLFKQKNERTRKNAKERKEFGNNNLAFLKDSDRKSL